MHDHNLSKDSEEMAIPHFKYVLLFAILIPFVSSEEEFYENSELSVVCDGSKLELIPTVIVTIAELHHLDGTNVNLMASVYLDYGLTKGKTTQTPSFLTKGWDFDLPSVLTTPTKSNQDVMKIVAKKSEAKCSDGGMFRCKMTYLEPPNSGPINVEKDMNYTGRGLVSFEETTVRPVRIDNEYTENMTLTVSCFAKGPLDYEFNWQRRCPLQMSYSSWPTASEIQEVTKTISTDIFGNPNDCRTYDHKQDLIFVTTLDLNNCNIKCQFGKKSPSFVEDFSGNLTIVVMKTEPTPNPSPSKSGDSEKLAIGLGVGLSLLAVIVIVILVYIFCFRKRNKDQKYKENGQDLAESNPATHLPPPVVYSKPNKQPRSEKDTYVEGMTNVALDTSYDSKDSANRGPPRYANNPEGQGPPNYSSNDDNEPQRRRPSKDDGQDNRGYSTDPDPTSDGGRSRYRNRVRSNRSHNSSRDYDEEPHNRSYDRQPRSYDYDPQPAQPRTNDFDQEPKSFTPRMHDYSADDNTDYGDPSLGTAI